MGKFGISLSGCMGDIINITPTIKYFSRCHNQKLYLETNLPHLFKNNPYIEKIYDVNRGEKMPSDVSVYNCNIHNNNENQKQIRKMSMFDYYATSLGFQLLPEERNLEFYPDPLDIVLPEGKYIVFNPSITWPSRTWDKEKWEELAEKVINLGFKVVVDGKDISYDDDELKTFHSISNPNIINTANKLNLSQLWHLLQNSFAVVTLDTGMLHFAGTTDTNIVELGSAIHHYYKTPWRNGSQDYKHKFVGGSCKLFCQSDMKYNVSGDEKITRFNGFRPHGCFENKPTFECQPSVNGVYNAILELLIENKK
jgi:ADP-heptose:LPS heptosyltransferase